MGAFSKAKIDWSPFSICPPEIKAPYPRSLTTPEGLGDRLRFVAFAEKQAENAFRLAAFNFPNLPERVKATWLELSREEAKHLSWLLDRMQALGVDPAERPQSLALWNSFDRCTTASEFAIFMANAEERGRIAGEQFYETLMKTDPITGELFRRIAEEEQSHIALARSVMQDLGH